MDLRFLDHEVHCRSSKDNWYRRPEAAPSGPSS